MIEQNMPNGQELQFAQYAEEVSDLLSRSKGTKMSAEEVQDYERQLVGLVAGKMREVLEGNRTVLPAFLSVTRRACISGPIHRSMNSDYYGRFLERVLIEALSPKEG